LLQLLSFTVSDSNLFHHAQNISSDDAEVIGRLFSNVWTSFATCLTRVDLYKTRGELIASEGHILRKTDLVLDHWERITDTEDLCVFKSCFEARDRLAMEKANGGS
jgi:hypothetical protein